MFVYQLNLSNDHADELNAGGWGSTAWDNAYANLTMGGVKNFESMYEILFENDIVQHTMTIDSNDLDEIFALGNGMGDQSKIHYHVDCTKSISVGDTEKELEYYQKFYKSVLDTKMSEIEIESLLNGVK